MDQHLVCPHCNQTVAVSTSLAGQAAQCPYCNGEFTVPGQAPEPQLASFQPQYPQQLQGAGQGQGLGNRNRQPGHWGRPAGNLNAGGGSRNPGAAAPRPRVNRPAAPASGGNSRLLIGVIVAMAAACLPIFMYLGYNVFHRSPEVAATSTADANPIQATAEPSAPPNGVAADNGAANTASSPTTVSSNSFAPPAVQPPTPSIAPSVTGPSPSSLPASNTVPSAPPAGVAPPMASSPSPAGSFPSPVGGTLPPAGSPTPPANGGFAGANPASPPPLKDKPANAAPGSAREVVQAVEPSVVVVEVPNVGLGSGFVIDDQGTIATNYHVIEGAKEASIRFPADKTSFPVLGFTAIVPGKDLAILKFNPGGKPLKPLPMAMGSPEKGEQVLAFGAPRGFDSSVSDGIVSSVRNGTDLRDLLMQGTKTDVYTTYLGYDLDAVWIQTTAPISGGNSGGPLVNLRGEVVGLNTWNRTDGQNLNFAISIDHLRKLTQSTPSSPRPLSELPAPRKQSGGGAEYAAGDPKRTLDYWTQIGKVNRTMYGRLKKVARPSLSGAKNAQRLKVKMAGYYRKLAEILPEYAARLKDLDVKQVDGELVAVVTADAMIMESIAEDLRKLAFSAELGRITIFDTEQIMKKSYGGDGANIAQAYDLLRIKFNLKYKLTFPNIAGDAPRSASDASDAADADENDDSPDNSKGKSDDKQDDPEKASARSLALAKQMLKNPITRAAGLEKLEKIVADYPDTPAAEEAKKLLKQFGSTKKSSAGR